ncbi:MAG: serine/threonine protein kinase, partial [Micromonosporaceae bacterium]
IGTPSFMAPERAADAMVGPSADLWSLGTTLYFAVQGRSPYERASTLATLSALASEDVPFAPTSGPLWPVLAGLLRREPGARLAEPTVRAMLQDIAAPTPPPAPAWSAQPSRRAALLVAAVLALIVGVLASFAPRAVPPREGTGTAPSTRPTSVDQPLPAAAVTPGGTGPPGEAALVLPDGWHMYVDTTGFSVAVPTSWTVSRRGSIVYFDEPGGGGRLLGIDQTDQPEPDPVADWQAKETYRVARGDFPDYQRVRLVAVDYFVRAADWEFTYRRDGVRQHVNNRGFITSPHRAYGMWWSTPDANWNRFRPDLQLIQRSFRPASE